MRYDFDTLINRRGTNSLKWDVPVDQLPMWVGDMDFMVAPEIRSALEMRTAHGVFGYSVIPEEWRQAYVDWWQRRHGWTMEKEWLLFSTGVVPAISSVVRKLTTPAEKVLLQTPVYNMFFNCVLNNGRQVLESYLTYDGCRYSIDFEDLEQKLADPQTALMVLCNPHNPMGKVWDRETLARIGDLCHRHHVVVLSDEIHCDLTDPGREYVPFASASELCRNNSVTCMAPTKAFNMAGLHTAAVMVPNPALRHKVWRALNTDEVAEPNAFAVQAAVAAWTEGAAWLDEVRQYIFDNKKRTVDFIENHVQGIHVAPSEATYFLWLDCSGLGGTSAEIARYLRCEAGLYLSEGGQFGGNGTQFLRMNVACPKATLEDGLMRLKKGCLAYAQARGDV